MRRIVLATRNAHKVGELQAILPPRNALVTMRGRLVVERMLVVHRTIDAIHARMANMRVAELRRQDWTAEVRRGTPACSEIAVVEHAIELWLVQHFGYEHDVRLPCRDVVAHAIARVGRAELVLVRVAGERHVADVDAAASASLVVLASTETVASIRTASGTTKVVPVALTAIYRTVGSAAIAGTERVTPPMSEKAMVRAAILRNDVVFMY